MSKTPLDFDGLYETFYPKIIHYLSRLVGEQEAEEVAQIAFEKISRRLDTFAGKSKLSTWVYQVATNAALDRLKSPAYKHSHSGPLAAFPIHEAKVATALPDNTDKQASPERKIIRDEMNACIREFVAKLPPDYMTVITLNEIKGFTNKEIAEILDISVDAAKIRLHRARAQLKKLLEQGCDFYHDERNELACDRKQ